MIVAKTIMLIINDYRPMVGIRNANLTWEDLALDSLDKVEIIMDIEKQCHVKIPNDIAMSIETPRDMIVTVRRIRNKSNLHDPFQRIKPMGGGMCCIHQAEPTCIIDMKPCTRINQNSVKNQFHEVCAQCNCAKFQNFIKIK